MQIPIIMTAFGTTSAARKIYDILEQEVRAHYPQSEVYWGYTSRLIARKLEKEQGEKVFHPVEIVERLGAEGRENAVVQPLHLLPGTEFHRLNASLGRIATVKCTVGLPILHSPLDYSEATELLSEDIENNPDAGILVVGHGTSHAAWPAYLALEHLLQKRFGPRVAVGTVEHYPPTDKVEDHFMALGLQRIVLIPFFLVAGRHFRVDMMGEADHSWRSRLARVGLEVSAIERGLGQLPGFSKIFLRHLDHAMGRAALDR